MTTILIKKKDTAGAPAAGDLTNAAGGAEIAVNTATKRIYTKDSGGNVVEVGTNPTATTMNGNLTFVPDATYDIGATGATRPRDIFMSRNLTVGGTMTVAGGINFNGNVTVGDSSADTLTINSTITSNLIFTDNTYDIGASGATRPRTGYFGTSIFTPLLDATNVEVTNIKALDGTASATIANSTGVITIGSSILTTTDINGGTIDGTTIGTNVPAVGVFTNLRVGTATSDELLTINGSSAGFVARITNTTASNPNGLYINSTNAIGTGSALRVDSQGISLLTLNVSGLAVTGAISATASIKAATSVAAQGTFAGYTGAGIFMSYESTYGRIESYDYSLPGYKDIGISPNGGNVGVGMVGSSTFGKFTVNGNIAQYGSTSSGNELGRIVWFNTANNYETGSIRMVIGAGQINRGEIGFYVNNGGGQIKAMYIDYGQNVDISTGGAILSLNRGQYSQQTKFYQDTSGSGAQYETTNPSVNAQYYAHIFKGTNNVPTTVEYGRFNQFGLGLGGAGPSSGTGITFPATQAASTDANTLDDYEEGTFAPTITYETPGTLSVTYSNNTGRYIKIGKLVYINIDIRINGFTKGTASGPWGFTGLPFSTFNTGGYNNFNTTSVQFYNASYNTSNLPLSSLNSNGGTTVFMYTMVSGSVNGNQNDPANSAIYQMTLFYETAT